MLMWTFGHCISISAMDFERSLPIKKYIDRWVQNSGRNDVCLYIPLQNLCYFVVDRLSSTSIVSPLAISREISTIMKRDDVLSYVINHHADDYSLMAELIDCAIREFLIDNLKQKGITISYKQSLQPNESILENLLWTLLDDKEIRREYRRFFYHKDSLVDSYIASVYEKVPELQVYRNKLLSMNKFN